MVSVALLAGVVAVSSGLASSDASTFTVTSSLDGKTVLPLRSHWIACPQLDPSQGQVAEVDYFIDGFHPWSARQAPWSFGGDGNSLVTTLLKPGLHTFAVRAITAEGRMANDKASARVIAAPQPPPKLAGAWTRIVAAQDLKKGPPGPAAGRWTITISRIGWMTGSNQWLDVRYLAPGNVVIGPEIVDRPEQTGGFCGVDPLHIWKSGFRRMTNACGSSPAAPTPVATASQSFRALGRASTEHKELTMRIFNAKRLLLVGLMALVATAIASRQASAATLTVCPSGCAFSQIEPAINAAKNGDTIVVAAGTYNGGFTIDKSVKLVGAAAGATIIKGGGPVVTIGKAFAATEPTVSISGVTITGGKTRTSWATGLGDGVIALGGGIEIPPNSDFSGGATVTIANSIISGNELAPSATAPVGPPCPDGNPCPFAAAFGGGIDNWGSLTLANTTVSNNLIGGASGLGALASDAEGAGIRNVLGPLTITNSDISGNQAAVTAPGGRFADAGGILLVGGTLTMSNTSVADNSATVAAAFPSSVEVGVAAGGMHLTGDVQAVTISNSSISGNVATATNKLGDISASSAGLHIDIADSNSVTLSNDVIDGNSARAAALPGSTGNADAGSGAGEVTGALSNVRLTGNSVDASSAAGNASAEGGASVFDGGSITNSLISDNHVHVSAPGGSATVQGGGIFVAVSLTLRNSTVNGNTADAGGASGSARGGGIFDVAFPFGPDGPPGGPLVLQNSKLTDNALTGQGFTPQGGGLYIQNEPLTSTNSVIANNTPDQCFGC